MTNSQKNKLISLIRDFQTEQITWAKLDKLHDLERWGPLDPHDSTLSDLLEAEKSATNIERELMDFIDTL